MIIPLLPTPTGIWSNNDWVNSSFIGLISFSDRFVLNKRTPQLISKPTPPGDTIDLLFEVSNAAKFPIAKP